MTKDMGLWIDHQRAVVVTLLPEGEAVTEMASDMEKHVRYSGASHSQSPNGHTDAAEDKRDRRFDDHLHKYYAEVAALLHDADAILILGPGEAKGEFRKYLESQPASKTLVDIETADKLTDGQIVAEVKKHFHR